MAELKNKNNPALHKPRRRVLCEGEREDARNVLMASRRPRRKRGSSTHAPTVPGMASGI